MNKMKRKESRAILFNVIFLGTLITATEGTACHTSLGSRVFLEPQIDAMKDARTSVELVRANVVGIYFAANSVACYEAMNYL